MYFGVCFITPHNYINKQNAGKGCNFGNAVVALGTAANKNRGICPIEYQILFHVIKILLWIRIIIILAQNTSQVTFYSLFENWLLMTSSHINDVISALLMMMDDSK